MKTNLRLLTVFVTLIALLVGTVTFAQQKGLTAKEKLLIEKGQVKMPEAGLNIKTFLKAPANSPSLNRLVKNNNRGLAYAVDALSGNVVSFDLATPGTFTTIATLTLTGTNFICAGSWADNTWYVAEYYDSGDYTLGTIDPSDGTYTVLGAMGAGINALAYDNVTNTMYGAGYDGASNSQLYSINLSTGVATLIGDAGAGIIIGLACNTGGTLYAANLDDNLYTVDKATGAATVVGPLGININYGQDLEYDNENDVLYLAGYTTLASLYTVDPVAGGATLVGDFPAGTEICGLAVPYNAVVYTNDIALQSIISPATGPNLTATEIVTIRVKNNGTASQSAIAVSYTVNGGTAVNALIAGPIAAGEFVDYTFVQTADLSVVQSYEIVATAILPGDENLNNNSKTKTVVNQGNMILMQNGTITTCSGTFYDTGGPGGSYQNSENITMTIAPGTPGAKLKLNFTAFDCENTYDFLKVYDGPDISAPLVGDFTGAAVPAALVELIASPGNASGAMTFNFTSDGSVPKTGWEAAISCVIPFTHDLVGASVSGNITPTLGTASNYIVTVANSSVSAELGSSYTVSLYDASDVLVGSAPGVDIAVGELKTFTFAWTPAVEGPTYLYGKVVLSGDEDATNDQTPNFNVNVQPSGVIVVTIGTGTELFGTPRTPFDFYWKNSLCESLYFPDEIGQPAGTLITQVVYHNSFVSDLPNKPVKIFMGETSLEDLTGGWISANDLTLVFDGTVSFPAGTNDIIIPLTVPYTYNGSNLVIMTNRPLDTQYFNTNDKYLSTTSVTHPNRTLGVGADATTYDPYAPPVAPAALSYFPNTMLYMVPGGPTSIFTSDFESYTAGEQVACVDPVNWTTWSNAPCGAEDAYISTDYANSPVNSVKIENSNDLVLLMGNKTSGKYEMMFDMYVPADFAGYYNILQDFAGSTSKWGVEVYFHTDGTAIVNAGGEGAASFNYTHDQWIPIKNVIDLNNDHAELFINNVSIYSWQWSLGATGTGGINQISAADFFAGADVNFPTDVAKYYLDDMVYQEAAPSGFDVTFTVSNYISVPLAGAAVQVKKGGLTYDGITNASGVCTFPALFAGTYTYSVSLAGYVTATGTLTGDATNLAISVTLLEDIVAPYSLAIYDDGTDAFFSWNNVPTSVSVLVVDHDASNAVTFTDDWTILQPALDASMLVDYTYFEADPVTFAGPDLATMQNYDVVLWFTGEAWHLGQTMIPADQANIRSYLDGGGKFILSGQDYLYDQSETGSVYAAGSFEYDVLGISAVTQDAIVIESPAEGTGAGTAGNFLEGTSYSVSDIYTTAKEGLFIDDITGLTSSALPLMDMLTPTAGLGAVSTPNTVFSTISLASITDQATITAVIDAMVSNLVSGPVKGTDAFLSYSVYLDNLTTPVATNITGTTHTFLDVPAGDHVAGVRSVYTTGQSAVVTIPWVMGEVSVKPVASGNINIYPNPTKGKISIENLSDANIYITNIMGNVIAVKENVTGTASFDLSDVAKGMYLVKIVSNNKVITKKVNVIN